MLHSLNHGREEHLPHGYAGEFRTLYRRIGKELAAKMTGRLETVVNQRSFFYVQYFIWTLTSDEMIDAVAERIADPVRIWQLCAHLVWFHLMTDQKSEWFTDISEDFNYWFLRVERQRGGRRLAVPSQFSQSFPVRLRGISLEKVEQLRSHPDYREYLSSEEWRIRKKPVLRRAQGRCERCFQSGKILSVHHKHYCTLGYESPDDLEALCDKCHL
jgi:hypothetical protein